MTSFQRNPHDTGAEAPARWRSSVEFSSYADRSALRGRPAEIRERQLGDALLDFAQLVVSSDEMPLGPFDAACFSRWRARWARRLVSTIAHAEIAEYLADLTRKGAAARDLARERELLRRFFRWAERRGWIRFNPTERLPRTRPRTSGQSVTWNALEQHQLLAACQEEGAADPHKRYLFPVVLTALKTGLRLGHVIHLEWRHVDLRQGLIRIPAAETSSGREIQATLDVELRRVLGDLLLAACAGNRRNAHVFAVAGMPEWKGRPEQSAILVAFRLARMRAGVPAGGFDSLRLTFAHNCAVACIPMGYPLRVGDWDDKAPVERVYTEHARTRRAR